MINNNKHKAKHLQNIELANKNMNNINYNLNKDYSNEAINGKMIYILGKIKVLIKMKIQIE